MGGEEAIAAVVFLGCLFGKASLLKFCDEWLVEVVVLLIKGDIAPSGSVTARSQQLGVTTGRKRGSAVALPVFLSAPVERRCVPAGANPARQLSFQPEAVGAVQGGNELD